MPIYDFSDPAWTDARIAAELATALQLPHGDERASRVGPLVLEQGRRRRKRAIEHEGDEPATKTQQRRKAKPKAERFPWNFAVPPNAIWDGPELSDAAKLAAWGIARRLNLGRWNADLHVDLTYADFAPLSARKARRGVTELRIAGYIRTETLNRGGVRYWFGQKCYRPKPV